MLVIVLLAVVGVLAIVLGVVAASRRGDPPAVSTADPAPVPGPAPAAPAAGATAAPDGAATAMPADALEPRTVMAEPPPMRPLLRRMYAAVMDTPSLAE
ncbi:HDOD domain-containing protein, partial [Xanthomonas campestris]